MGVEFSDADGSRLSDVGVGIFEAVSEGLDEGEEDGGNLDVGHSADGEGSDEGVVGVCVLKREKESLELVDLVVLPSFLLGGCCANSHEGIQP